jgi:YVTN family beta-propeller protein
MRSNARARNISEMKTRPAIAFVKLAVILIALSAVNSSLTCAQQESGGGPQQYTHEGVRVEFEAEPVERGKGLMEGAEAVVRFKIVDQTAGKPLSNLRPAAWLDLRGAGNRTDERGCREKIQSFLQASLSARPDIDLNSYFILALNQEPNISVIDPLSGFGSTKLFTLVALASPGEDWLLSGDKKRLYVSMPLAGQVAVVDTVTWKVVSNIPAGTRPTRLALQHDEKYLWVGDDGDDKAAGGVTAIDTTQLKPLAQITTGAGHHEIAFTDDDRYAFVTNRAAGTLSVIDVRGLSKVKDLKTGAQPSAVAFSSLGKAVYVAHETDGTIVAVGGAGHEILAQMKAQPGINALSFAPGGRFGFAVNRATNSVHVFDVATNRLAYNVPVGPKPDQLVFTKDFAYVRSTASEFVSMIKISGLGERGYEPAVSRFPAGQRAPQDSPSTSHAPVIVPAPESGAVLVANPADKMIYFYTEGMSAPMGSFQNYRRDPRGVLVLDNSLTETSPGVYTTTVRFNGHGQYDVPFLLDSPRVVNCFSIAVAENPALPKKQEVPIRVEPLLTDAPLRVGESYRLRFRVTDSATKQPKDDADMGVLVFLAPGIWQQRDWAKMVGDGVYETSFVPPQEGVYYIYFQAPKLGVRFNQIPFITLEAVKASNSSEEK